MDKVTISNIKTNSRFSSILQTRLHDSVKQLEMGLNVTG